MNRLSRKIVKDESKEGRNKNDFFSPFLCFTQGRITKICGLSGVSTNAAYLTVFKEKIFCRNKINCQPIKCTFCFTTLSCVLNFKYYFSHKNFMYDIADAAIFSQLRNVINAIYRSLYNNVSII
jgi:hypothetical protein